MGPIWSALHRPFSVTMVEKWDGALAPEQQEASLWLYDAIVSRNLNLVKATLRLGARVNTRLRKNSVHPSFSDLSPLEMAVWMETHGSDDATLRVVDREGQLMSERMRLDVDGHNPSRVAPDTGIVQALLAAGATGVRNLRLYFEGNEWLRYEHPTFIALERHNLNVLAYGGSYAIPTLERRDADLLGRRSLSFSSVVPSMDHPPHQWLHRAIVRERWDVVQTWVKEGGAVWFPGNASPLGMVCDGMLKAARLKSSSKPWIRAFALIRPAVLRENDEGYRHEVLAALATVAYDETLPLPSRTSTWTNNEPLGLIEALVKKRPLLNSVITPEEWAMLFVDDTFGVKDQTQGWVNNLEAKALTKNLPKGLLSDTPTRRRL